MDLRNFHSVSIGGVSMKQLLLNGVEIWKKAAKAITNWVKKAVDSAGNLYNSLGYKTGFRIRSGGAEISESNGICTGFIPCKKGDVLRIQPPLGQNNTCSAINFSNASFSNLGQIVRSLPSSTHEYFAYGVCAEISQFNPDGWTPVTTETETTLTLTASNADNVAYVRVTHSVELANAENFIITINEVIV